MFFSLLSVIESKNHLELGAFINSSFDFGEITFSYFDGYDRIFNLAGINVFSGSNSNDTYLDTLFSYRKTKATGIGGLFFIGDLTLRGDYSIFHTKDKSDIGKKYD